MCRYFQFKLNRAKLHRSKTDFVVLARCTFVYTNVISLPSPCSREKGVASELGFPETKDFQHGT
jgi:hypothetical protein